MPCPAAQLTGRSGGPLDHKHEAGEGGEGECCNDRLSICKVQELLPAKDIEEALFVSESKDPDSEGSLHQKWGQGEEGGILRSFRPSSS